MDLSAHSAGMIGFIHACVFNAEVAWHLDKMIRNHQGVCTFMSRMHSTGTLTGRALIVACKSSGVTETLTLTCRISSRR
jgi:hypothetical protein